MSSSTNLVIMMVLGIIVGAGGVYLITNSQIQTLTQNYESQLNEINEILELTSGQKEAEIEDLENVVEDIQNAIESLQAQNSKYQNEIEDLEEEKETLKDEIEEYEEEVSSLEHQLWSKDSDISYLEDRLDDILDLDVTQHYEWEYGWSDWTWDLTIPLDLYWDYYDENRPPAWEDWVAMCNDPGDDYYINQLVNAFERAASDQGYSKYETVEYVISFVQSMPYTVDDETTPWNEYPRYPVETLFDRGGDCEDTSILTATILYEMGYDVALLILEDDNHCAVGLSGGEGVFGTYYSEGGTDYFYIETTGDGWGIGDFPSSFKSGEAYVYPLKDY